MGFLGDVMNGVKRNMASEATRGISSSVTKSATGLFKKNTPSANGCPKCKKPISGTPKFCPSCGFKLTIDCAACKKSYPVGTKFCTDCGGKLQ